MIKQYIPRAEVKKEFLGRVGTLSAPLATEKNGERQHKGGRRVALASPALPLLLRLSINHSHLTMAPSEPYVVPEATLSHFKSNPWANSLISSPDYVPVETRSRTAKPSGEDSFFANTLGAADAIPHCLTLRKRDIIPPGGPPSYSTAESGAGSTSKPASQTPKHKPKSKPDMITLFHLERPGVLGHPSIAHGGVVATLLDEVMSTAVELQIPDSDPNKEDIRNRIFTVQLDVGFKRKVSVPGLVVVKAWCVATEGGRKFWMNGEMVQEEGEGGDSGGGGHLEWAKRKRVCADAKGFWLAARAEKL